MCFTFYLNKMRGTNENIFSALLQVEGLDIPLKRNQAYVMKFIMQTYSKTAYVFDFSREMRSVRPSHPLSFSRDFMTIVLIPFGSY